MTNSISNSRYNFTRLMFYLTSYFLNSVDRLQKLITPTYLYLLSISHFFYMISVFLYFLIQQIMPDFSRGVLSSKTRKVVESSSKSKALTNKPHQRKDLVHTIQQNLLLSQRFEGLLREAWNTVIPDGYQRKDDLRAVLKKLGNRQKYTDSLSIEDQKFLRKVQELVLLEDACKFFDNYGYCI
ncbi:hypothetical protein K7432_000823 [Basidiobolus ranarum]|uniref:Uncharacterized protein n=1 Tax=Basidiobolus ranarum TaxID=34480 RepID=A0ABR2X3X8_9FUNG